MNNIQARVEKKKKKNQEVEPMRNIQVWVGKKELEKMEPTRSIQTRVRKK